MSGTLGTVALPPPMVFLSDTREDVVSSVIHQVLLVTTLVPGHFFFTSINYTIQILLFKFCQQSKKKQTII